MKLNLTEEFSKIDHYFSPRIVGEVNNEFVKLAKINGEEIPWHNHANEDELFYVIEGSLLMEIENESPFAMKKGDLFIVKKGVEHRVSSENDCMIMLIESKTTKHTGEKHTKITKSIEEQSY